MEKCKSHHYIFTQKGKFVCTVCGHERKNYKKAKKQVTVISAFVAVAIAGFFAYQNLGLIEHNATPVINQTTQTVGTFVNKIPIENGTNSALQVFHIAQKEIPKIINVPSHIISNPAVSIPGITKSYSDTELVNYALQLINEDRKNANLSPVILSDNTAAQIHAQDVFQTRQISHWMTNGEKPYMTYTRLGGLGYVSQNVATSLCDGFSCGIDPMEQIRSSEHEMICKREDLSWEYYASLVLFTCMQKSTQCFLSLNQF